ncbi:MAG TPA: hypothetical protein VMG09_00345 [Bacteroidota bacterium]|nr:hypothetical protein [Bacteroidota bacterium]
MAHLLFAASTVMNGGRPTLSALTVRTAAGAHSITVTTEQRIVLESSTSAARVAKGMPRDSRSAAVNIPTRRIGWAHRPVRHSI